MKSVRIYTTPTCPYCIAAKRFLDKRRVPFEEIDVANDDALRSWLVTATGQRTVPQIFFGERSVGGYTDMCALEERGEFAAALADLPPSMRRD